MFFHFVVLLKILNGIIRFEIKYTCVMIILSPNLVALSCIWIFYGGIDAWPINTAIPGMTLLFLECGMS